MIRYIAAAECNRRIECIQRDILEHVRLDKLIRLETIMQNAESELVLFAIAELQTELMERNDVRYLTVVSWLERCGLTTDAIIDYCLCQTPIHEVAGHGKNEWNIGD